jgi:hypothetical protein
MVLFRTKPSAYKSAFSEHHRWIDLVSLSNVSGVDMRALGGTNGTFMDTRAHTPHFKPTCSTYRWFLPIWTRPGL